MFSGFYVSQLRLRYELWLFDLNTIGRFMNMGPGNCAPTKRLC